MSKPTCNEVCEKMDAFISSTEQALSGNDEFLDSAFKRDLNAKREVILSQMKSLPFSVRIINPKLSSRKKTMKKICHSLIVIHTKMIMLM